MIWAGDFNRHHPLWDRDEDVHLFTPQSARSANRLINILADYRMVMPLPIGIVTGMRNPWVLAWGLLGLGYGLGILYPKETRTLATGMAGLIRIQTSLDAASMG